MTNTKYFLEAHSGLSAKLVDKSSFDGVWVSSLTHAAIHGLPDNELLNLRERAELVEEVRRATDKPILVDIDTGGGIEHLPFFVKGLEKAGAWALVMEDKKYPKQNSLIEGEVEHYLEDVDVFRKKIQVAKDNLKDTKIFARLESLIAKHSMWEALIRAEAYMKAGVDGIVIHSKEKISASEVMEFAAAFKNLCDLPLIAIPTTYDLPKDHLFDYVVYANMMLRASFLAMQKVANLKNPKEAEMSSVKDIFDLVGR